MECCFEDYWKCFNENVWMDPFQRGVCIALAAVAGVLLLYCFLKLIFRIKFGCRRCANVKVCTPSGDIVVSTDAISTAVRNELKRFPQLELRKILLFSRRGGYVMELRGSFSSSGNIEGMPQIIEALKPLLVERMNTLFGIEKLESITFVIERFNADEKSEASGYHTAEYPVPNSRDSK